MDDRKKEALERAYARFTEEENKKAREAAAKYARYLKEQNLKPGELKKPEEAENIETAEKAEAEAESKSKTKSKPNLKFHPIRAFGNGLAACIDLHDRVQAKLDDVFIEMGRSLYAEYFSMLKRYKASRRRIGFACMTMVILSCAMLLVFDHFTVYEYAYNGRVLGYVDNQEKVTDVLEVAGDQLAKNNGVPIEFKSGDNITFRRVSSVSKAVDSSDEAVNKLAYMTDIEVNAFGIYEDGKLVTIVESEAGANNAINQAKRMQSRPDDGMKLISADFLKPITVEPVTVMITSVQSHQKAIKQMTEGGSVEIYHIVNSEDTIKSIAEEFGVDESNVCDVETKKTLKTLEAGDKVLIKKDVEPIKVKMVEDGSMSEVIPFKSVKQPTKDLYKGETQVTQKGQDGKQAITGKITKVNGKITKRDLKSTEVITPARDEITLVGTAERPKTAPTGVYGMPIRNYVISSEFGYRWGRNHDGIDFAASTGTPIYAADGGTVVTAGVYGGYGYCIDIDHGNGKLTRYGHCSQLLVSEGQKVYKGQEIGLVGSTGNSTGPHLHFEIRNGGTAVDPGPILGVY